MKSCKCECCKKRLEYASTLTIGSLRFKQRTMDKLGIMMHINDDELAASPAIRLCKYSWRDIQAIHGAGESTIAEVITRLRMVGLALKEIEN